MGVVDGREAVAVGRDRRARERPSRAWAGTRKLWPKLRLFGEVAQELGEARRRWDGVAAQGEAGVLVAELEMLGRQMARRSVDGPNS